MEEAPAAPLQQSVWNPWQLQKLLIDSLVLGSYLWTKETVRQETAANSGLFIF